MPTYGKENFKESNVNYLNKDFNALKKSLIDYAKSYFPNSYRDFNETSPGMMLLEMNAYVGDVLSFYIDQQYREMLLPLAEERRNIINMARMFGYKVKPIVPAFVDLTFTSEVNALSTNRSKVDYSDGGIWNPGIEIVSNTDSEIIFTTLEHADFTITGSNDTNTIGSTNSSELASTYTLSRTVKAVSATEKTLSFQIGAPEKFKTITLPDTNVIDIISCVDSNGNDWYEVDFLAQDKVPISVHYTDDVNRTSAYGDAGGLMSTTAVPFSLSYVETTKRFTRETNLDNTTSLVFGNGILKDGQIVDGSYIDLEQIGVVIPGQTNDLNEAINPLLGNEYSTLGETPNNITLTIKYRIGGGISSNVPVGDLTSTPDATADGGNISATFTSVNNATAARGGKNEEDTIEIKEKAKAFFSTQNRCVTKEDYEARILNIPGKYGNIAKVYVSRAGETDLQNTPEMMTFAEGISEVNSVLAGNLESRLREDGNLHRGAEDLVAGEINLNQMLNKISTTYDYLQDAKTSFTEKIASIGPNLFSLSSIDIYVLAYNNAKHLVGNPLFTNNSIPSTLSSNILNYLDNFRIMTDSLTINNGYIINFGVIFDIIAEKYADKQQVKFNCIQKIKDYFRIEKMQFNQPINKSQLEFELMGVEGVRSIGHVTITQKDDYFYELYQPGQEMPFDATLPNSTYTYSKVGNNFADASLDENGGQGTSGYGYKYNFKNNLSDDGTIILPAHSDTPAVFELKNPNQNIQGRVR